MSTPQVSPTDSPEKIYISSKFYQNVCIKKTPEIKADTNKSYKTIHNGAIMENTIKSWNKLQQPNKKKYLELIKQRIRNFDRSDCQVIIGEAIFNCYRIVLQSYSVYFNNLNIINGKPIYLPADKINSVAFIKIYKWMLSPLLPVPEVERNGIIELYVAAQFLEIDELRYQILACFDNCEIFNEDSAFYLYWEARSFNESDIQELMLMRIQKYFLTLVATKEFLELTCEEVCSFLSLNTIGVRKESDVFYSALKWLNHNWEDREEYAMDVMKCVRFTLMAPWELTELRKNNKSLEVQKITIIRGVLEMIDKALRYN